MSERQRRKRMNNSMDKLGLLVYGKTFQDGLKVDKATLLKDAYEKLQTTKDDYHKGYETAITSTKTFLDHLEGCPQGVKDALTRHLHTTLHTNMHRCHSTTDTLPPEDTHSDSSSPRPMSSASMEVHQPRREILGDSGHVLKDPSPERSQIPYARSGMMISVAQEDSTSARSGSRQDGGPSWPRMVDVKLSPSLRTAPDVRPPSCRPATAEVKTTSCRTTPGVETPTSFRAVSEALLLSAAYSHANISKSRCEVDADTDTKPSSTNCPQSLRMSAIPAAAATSSSSSSSSRAWESSSSDPQTPARQGQSGRVGGGPYSHPPFPFPYLYTSSSPSSLSSSSFMPKISPYVTPFAPQDPLYLGSTPPSFTHPHSHPHHTFPATASPSRSPEVKPSSLPGAHPNPHPSRHPLPAHTPTTAPYAAGQTHVRYGGSSHAADDSGYISPVVPSPFTPQSVAQYGGVKKRYLRREMVRGGEETDEENDREVEQVFSRSGGFDSSDTTGSGMSEVSGPRLLYGKTSGPGLLYGKTSGPRLLYGKTSGPGLLYGKTSGPGLLYGKTSGPGLLYGKTSGPGLIHGKTSGPGLLYSKTSGPRLLHG
ncbi:hypothetical protein ACOMHN_045535 [Nucella lapillus]